MSLGAFRDKFVRELSTGSRRVVDLACVLAHDPRGAPARRALLGDRAARGRGARPAAPPDPRETGASLLIIEHDMPLLTSIAELLALDLGRVVTRGAPDDVLQGPDVVASYLGESEAVVSRSGPRGG